MHCPHCVHPVRSGPAPPKKGSGTVRPGASSPSGPKKTPTFVVVKVSPTPICSATVRIASSAGVLPAKRTEPSMRSAWS